MRVVIAALAGVAAFTIGQTAAAAPVTLAPISYSAEYQIKVDEEIGDRDSANLQAIITRSLRRALEREGAQIASSAPVTVEVTILDADPNRPTREEMSRNPSLDAIRSVSTGGADLSATLRGADGSVLGEVTHRYYTYSLADLIGPPDTWSDAQRAIQRFSRKVAESYAASAR